MRLNELYDELNIDKDLIWLKLSPFQLKGRSESELQMVHEE